MSYPTSPKEFNRIYMGYESGLKVTLTRTHYSETLIFYVPARGEPIQELMAQWVYINGYKAQVESFDV